MAKPAHSDAPTASGNGRPMMIEALQPEAIAETCNRVFKRVDEMNRAWIGTLHQASDAGWTLASRLVRCSDPMEVNRLCTDWLSERRDSLLNDGKRLSEMWFKLYEDELVTAPVRPFLTEAPPSVSRMHAAE